MLYDKLYSEDCLLYIDIQGIFFHRVHIYLWFVLFTVELFFYLELCDGRHGTRGREASGKVLGG